MLERTVNMRLVSGGDWKEMGELPSGWPSYEYQKLENGERDPSESVVALRIGAAGAELVRTGDDYAKKAGHFRTAPLDKGKAPNTVPANGQSGGSVESDSMRLGELVTEIENYKSKSDSDGSVRPLPPL